MGQSGLHESYLSFFMLDQPDSCPDVTQEILSLSLSQLLTISGQKVEWRDARRRGLCLVQCVVLLSFMHLTVACSSGSSKYVWHICVIYSQAYNLNKHSVTWIPVRYLDLTPNSEGSKYGELKQALIGLSLLARRMDKNLGGMLS